MFQFFNLIVSTIVLRPYVFVFFTCYLILAITHLGWKRTMLFTMVAYVVAFLCEWSSAVAATGFPFGLYSYIADTRDKELWIAGVPFMDSLSFTFLSYISWELSTFLLGKVKAGWRDVQITNGEEVRRSWPAALLASFSMMYLDIIIDPVALRGDRWFLGKIYYYPEGGVYFGVTIANFIGWFLVCLVIIRLFILLERFVFTWWLKSKGHQAAGVREYRYKGLGPVALYFGVLGFNLFMTFWIGEWLLGTVGVIIILPLVVIILITLSKADTISRDSESKLSR
jgi:uncharacterized membrane protein